MNNIFNVLCIGDIVGKAGRKVLDELLPKIIEDYKIDYIIANGENSAGGTGIVPDIAKELFQKKINVITTGNHIWNKKEIIDYINNQPRIIRPANLQPDIPGKGFFEEDILINNSSYKIIVINLIGRIFMNPANCPFHEFEKIYSKFISIKNKIIIVDFHAEATSEKTAAAFFADGKVSVFFGTHTHIQTADARILEKGTGYITDIGMCGSENSVIGVRKEIIINKFLTGLPAKNEVSLAEPLMFNGVVFTISLDNFKCSAVKPLYLYL